MEQPKQSSVRQMLEMDIGLKQELNRMFQASFKNKLITIILTAACTIAIIVVFIFYFTRPTKVDVLIFREIEKDRAALRFEREYIRQQRDSLKADRMALYNLQQKKK